MPRALGSLPLAGLAALVVDSFGVGPAMHSASAQEKEAAGAGSAGETVALAVERRIDDHSLTQRREKHRPVDSIANITSRS